MRRRTYLCLAGSLGVTGLSGCLTSEDGDSGDPGTASTEPSPTETTETDSPTPTPEPDDPVAAIESYFAAVAAGDAECGPSGAVAVFTQFDSTNLP